MADSTSTVECSCHNICVTGTRSTSAMESALRSRFQVASGVPVLRIHSGGISLGNMSQINVQVHGKHEVDVVCRECDCTLTVHASKKGAFAQIAVSRPKPVYGSLPREDAVGHAAQQIPSALARLFRTRDGDAFEIGGRPPEPVLRPRAGREAVEDDADYDLMFGHDEEPWVGSYSGLGGIETDHPDLRSPVDFE